MTSRERVICALHRGIPDRVPYCELGVDAPIVRQLLGDRADADAGGWYFDDGVDSADGVPAGEEADSGVELEKALSQALNRDNISYRFLPPVFAEMHVGQNGIQFYGDGHIKTAADIDRIVLPDPMDDCLYEPACRFLEGRDDYAVAAAGRLGLASTYLSIGIENFCMSLHEDPEFVEAVLDRYCTWSAAVFERVCTMGFDFVWLADDLAFKTSTYFSPQTYRRHILPHLRKVTERLTLPWVMHSDGNILPILDDAIEVLRPAAIHPIEPDAMDIKAVKQQYGDRLCLIGNVSVDLLAQGTVAEVEDAVRTLIHDVAPGGGYIMSSGNSLTSYCKIENIQAMIRTLDACGRYVNA
ncbi:MAG: uroporphyrinogen decarboxylase family protein [Lentisphaeria bacterium]|jgi:uroporphyrinogen decarboxylase|nr:uroporphyrinogen decarboxylase family protein [Lentisphaeria bacterium]